MNCPRKTFRPISRRRGAAIFEPVITKVIPYVKSNQVVINGSPRRLTLATALAAPNQV